MNPTELKLRLRKFSLRVLKMTDHLPKKRSAWIISDQISRSATSASANYRAACRSKSTRDFIYKLKIVEEELDETDHWLTMIREMDFLPAARLAELEREVNELLAIIVRSLLTVKERAGKR